MPPLVSCICPTFGRCPKYQSLIEEAIGSFVIQDYPNKEMIVINDAPGQVLECDHPDVKIFNLNQRFATLGEKLNFGIDAAQGDIIACFDDDDISLPFRLVQSVLMLGDADYWNPQRTWYAPHDQYRTFQLIWDHSHGVCHNASVFRKSAWEKVGRYPHQSGDQDAVLDQKLKINCTVAPPYPKDLPPDHYGYIYCWGRSNCHLSGVGAENHESFYKAWGEKPVEQGTFRLRPRQRYDYAALTKLALRTAPQ